MKVNFVYLCLKAYLVCVFSSTLDAKHAKNRCGVMVSRGVVIFSWNLRANYIATFIQVQQNAPNSIHLSIFLTAGQN